MGVFYLIPIMSCAKLISVSSVTKIQWQADPSGKRSRSWLQIAACAAGFAPPHHDRRLSFYSSAI